MVHKFIHVDMDCFFAAIEMRDNSTLIDIPMAVGEPSSKRGIITTANYPARKFGIHSGMSTAAAEKLCENLVVIKPRMQLYEEVSKQIYEIFYRYTHLVEPISIDEAFLDVTSSPFFKNSATLIAKNIRETIQNELKITASAGVAPIKFLAKIASEINKPNGQFTINEKEVDSFIDKLHLRKIPGIGPKTEERLIQMKLFTCLDVKRAGAIALVREFGKHGWFIWERSNGIDNNKIILKSEKKSLGVETTLCIDLYSINECEKIIADLVIDLDNKIKSLDEYYEIKSLGVKVKFSDFTLITHAEKCLEFNKKSFLSLLNNILKKIRTNKGIRLIGLFVSFEDPIFSKQLKLFTNE